MVMMMQAAEKKAGETGWNPSAAVSAQRRADKLGGWRESLGASFEVMKGWESMEGFTVSVQDEAGESRRVTMPEYLGMLSYEEAELRAEVERNGGQVAIESTITYVPYAGERPVAPAVRQPDARPNYPA